MNGPSLSGDRPSLRAVDFDPAPSLNRDDALELTRREWHEARDAYTEFLTHNPLMGMLWSREKVTYIRMKRMRREAREQVEKLTRVVDGLDRAIAAMERYDASKDGAS